MSLNATNLFIQASPLPATFRGNPNDLFTEMIKRMRILSPSGTNFIYVGDTEPTSNVGPWLRGGTQWWVFDQATKRYIPQDISASFTQAFFIGNTVPAGTNPTVWLRTTKDATTAAPLDFGAMIRWFTWNGTTWVSPHAIPANSQERKIWVGTETDLWSYDGGDGNDPGAFIPTDFTGAMWQVDAAFAFRFPLGVGTNPTTYDGNPASSVAPGNTGGEERHTLVIDEQAKHAHLLANSQSNVDLTVLTTQDPIAREGEGVASAPFAYALSKALSGEPDVGRVGYSGADKSHENMPPYVGVYFIKRTARKFYTP